MSQRLPYTIGNHIQAASLPGWLEKYINTGIAALAAEAKKNRKKSRKKPTTKKKAKK